MGGRRGPWDCRHSNKVVARGRTFLQPGGSGPTHQSLRECELVPEQVHRTVEGRDLKKSMTARDLPLADLSDDQLLAEVHRLAGAERGATAALIRSLIALDARPHLYSSAGCSSLFVYCTRVLHLAEGATYNRIEVARARGDSLSCSTRSRTDRSR